MKSDSSASWQGWFIGLGKLLLVCLALDGFFVSIKLLGAFREFGSGYGETLIMELACNPMVGLLIGILVTSIVQSSSVTTSLVVGLVAAGALGNDPTQAMVRAVPIIMGANVGTTITNILVSTAHIGNPREFERAFSSAVVHDMFNLLAIVVLLPLQIFTNFLGRLSLWLADLFAGDRRGHVREPFQGLCGSPEEADLLHLPGQGMDHASPGLRGLLRHVSDHRVPGQAEPGREGCQALHLPFQRTVCPAGRRFLPSRRPGFQAGNRDRDNGSDPPVRLTHPFSSASCGPRC